MLFVIACYNGPFINYLYICTQKQFNSLFGVKASEAKGYGFRLVLTSSSTRSAVIFGSFRRYVRGVKCLIFDRKMTEFKVIKTSGATPKDTYLGCAKVPEVPGVRIWHALASVMHRSCIGIASV